MDSSLQSRVGSSFSVSYPDFPSFTQKAQNFRLYQEAGKHDVMEITYPVLHDQYFKALKTGVPVLVQWSNDKFSGEFYGYVHDVSHTTQQVLERKTTIKVMGASFPLKEGGSKIWLKKTAPSIVEDIAKTFKLKAVVTPHSTIFPQQSLSGHSYFEKIQELAHKIGYVFQIYKTEIHFHPIDKMIDTFIGSMPVMSFKSNYISGPFDMIVSPTLDLFKPRVGDHFDKSLYSRKEKVVSGVDPITGQFYSVSSSPDKTGKNLRKDTKAPLFKQNLPTVISGNKAIATTFAKGHAELSRFSITAEGSGQGDPRFAPYKTIEINGTGDTTDGFWVVQKAMHFLSWDGRYTVDFTCMSDGTGGNKATSSRPSGSETFPVVKIDTTGKPKKPTSTKLTAKTAMLSQSNAGFKLTPRRWTGS